MATWAVEAQEELAPVDWDAVQREPFKRCFWPTAGDGVPDKVTCMAELATVAQRQELQIEIEDSAGKPMPGPLQSFTELGDILPSYVFKNLESNNWTTPMPIQAQALPLVLSGFNVIGLAQTGSGKTLAFLLPAIVQIEAQRHIGRYDTTPIALVLAPTRELAVQISEQALMALKGSKDGSNHRGGLWAACLYGGQRKDVQLKGLYGSQIVVATPGRLKDLILSRQLYLNRVTYFTLDEADRMLDLGFQGDVDAISKQIRPERQVLFFSATWQQHVQVLAAGLCADAPVRIAVGQKRAPGEATDAEGGDSSGTVVESALQARAGITQEVVVLDYPQEEWQRQLQEKSERLEVHLRAVLEENPENKVLVFVSQKDFADNLVNKLWEDGFKEVGAMHSGKSQESRLNALDRFRKGATRLLVATDVLGRGIDIPSVSHVVIFEMGTVEDYIHRIGRTARGKDAKGHALVFFEYYWKMPEIASQLVKVLEESAQAVPDDLRRIVREVQEGKRRGTAKNRSWDKKSSWDQQASWDKKTTYYGGGGDRAERWSRNRNFDEQWKGTQQPDQGDNTVTQQAGNAVAAQQAGNAVAAQQADTAVAAQQAVHAVAAQPAATPVAAGGDNTGWDW
mmetsp:Transcript_73074/g.136549  ORF Transcript_73074/g.136549 Transcript_73074/m.136549 type:complete len:624 (+) Transcript_73074:42-1913(+)